MGLNCLDAGDVRSHLQREAIKGSKVGGKPGGPGGLTPRDEVHNQISHDAVTRETKATHGAGIYDAHWQNGHGGTTQSGGDSNGTGTHGNGHGNVSGF